MFVRALRSWARFWGGGWVDLKVHFIWSHICSTGLRSGLTAGQGRKTLKPFWFKKFWVRIAQCAGALSCWNVGLPLPARHGSRWGLSTSAMYLLAVRLPLMKMSGVQPVLVIAPFAITLRLSPTVLTQLGENRSFALLKTLLLPSCVSILKSALIWKDQIVPSTCYPSLMQLCPLEPRSAVPRPKDSNAQYRLSRYNSTCPETPNYGIPWYSSTYSEFSWSLWGRFETVP